MSSLTQKTYFSKTMIWDSLIFELLSNLNYRFLDSCLHVSTVGIFQITSLNSSLSKTGVLSAIPNPRGKFS